MPTTINAGATASISLPAEQIIIGRGPGSAIVTSTQASFTQPLTAGDEWRIGPFDQVRTVGVTAGAAAISYDVSAFVDPARPVVVGDDGQVRDSKNGAPVSGGGLVSPTAYADATALQTAFPAASNSGKLGLVGASAPYALYASNGTAWAATGGVGDLPGMTAAAAAATDPQKRDFLAAINALGLPQYAITGATSVTAADHCGRVGVNNTATAYTLTIQTDALGGYTGNEIVYAFQGTTTGTVSLSSAGITLEAPAGSKTTTNGVGDYVSAQRIGANRWAITSVTASATASDLATLAASAERRIATQFRSARASEAGVTSISYFNTTSFSTLRDTSTVVTAARANTTPTTRMHRVGVRAAANAINRGSGYSFGGLGYFSGVPADKDIWPVTFVTGINDASPTLGTFFSGVAASGSPTAGATIWPTASHAAVVGCEDGDTQLQIIVQSSGSAKIKIPVTGSAFARTALGGVALAISIHRNDAGSELYFRIVNMDTGDVFTRTVNASDGTLPTSTGALTGYFIRDSCATAFQAETLFAAMTAGRPM